MFGDLVLAVVIGAAAAVGYYLYLRRQPAMPPGGPARALVTVGVAAAVIAFLLRVIF